MGGWRLPRYDVGSGSHLPDPTDARACLCGHTWDRLPTAMEWLEHRYGPAGGSDPRGTSPRNGALWHVQGMVTGLLLAAGAGHRMGMPKALVPGWMPAAVDALVEGGCVRVVVVLGSHADEARALVPPRAAIVVAEDWAKGMSHSLHTGLVALEVGDAPAALVHLVDLPDVTADVVRRVLAVGVRPDVLARATYDGRPGHPVLLGRDHWAGVLADAAGDEGARGYLAAQEVASIECGDLATGHDVDTR
jgi:CTP:molybdopterin cytidylyltransferase MocA